MDKVRVPMGAKSFVNGSSFIIAKTLKAKETPDDLVRRADKALYDAKRQGRNCTQANGVIESYDSTIAQPQDGKIDTVPANLSLT